MSGVSSIEWSRVAVRSGGSPTIKNHTATLVGTKKLFVFGGYDGRQNHQSLHIFDTERMTWDIDVRTKGVIPAGRNGHTATYVPSTRKIYIIGGWLGSGPLAADDMHCLDVDTLEWHRLSAEGASPGPCNMHTANYMPYNGKIYVFRGGDGREYLNDLHMLDLKSSTWTRPDAQGKRPVARANHSSAAEGRHLYIFGGWDGTKRLNDVHLFDTELRVWSEVQVEGIPPSPRAGMTFTVIREHIYLFGGSGSSAKCFDDLQILQSREKRWLSTVVVEADTPHHTMHTMHTHNGSMGHGARGGGGRAMSPCRQSCSSYHETGSPGEETREMMGHRQCGGGSDSGSMHYSMRSQSQKYAHHHRGNATANPMEETSGRDVIIYGCSPGRRAGHSATRVGRRLFLFGGSYGSEYLSDFYVLDTDPPPSVSVRALSPPQMLLRRLPAAFDTAAFSDVSFIVEGKAVHAHRLVLSAMSERFRAMFSAGFKEAAQREIQVDGSIRYDAFRVMIEYFYTGSVAPFRCSGRDSSEAIEVTLQLLDLADRFMIDHLKQLCEQELQRALQTDSAKVLLSCADRANALQLKQLCEHFIRNNNNNRNNTKNNTHDDDQSGRKQAHALGK